MLQKVKPLYTTSKGESNTEPLLRFRNVFDDCSTTFLGDARPLIFSPLNYY